MTQTDYIHLLLSQTIISLADETAKGLGVPRAMKLIIMIGKCPCIRACLIEANDRGHVTCIWACTNDRGARCMYNGQDKDYLPVIRSYNNGNKAIIGAIIMSIYG